jgi:enoyl-CoA hydratase/carnithine racemase
VKVGLAGTDLGASYLLPRVVGLAKATEMLFTGDFVSAPEAERIGLYNRVVPLDQLVEVTREFAERLARGPGFALAKTKEMLGRELHMDLAAAFACEEQAQALCMAHPDFREAYDAFVGKRKPNFE